MCPHGHVHLAHVTPSASVAKGLRLRSARSTSASASASARSRSLGVNLSYAYAGRGVCTPVGRVRTLRALWRLVLRAQSKPWIAPDVFYACSANHKRGQAVCGNGHVMRKDRIDHAVHETVLRTLDGDVLRPAIVSAVLDGVFEAMAPGAVAPTIERARAELAIVERAIARFVEALALGGDMAAVIAALKARQTRQAELQRTRWGRGRASARRSEGRRAAGTRSVGWLAGAPDVGSRRGWPATVSRNSSRADPVHPGKGRETDVPIRGRNRVRSAVLGDCGPCTLYGVPNGEWRMCGPGGRRPRWSQASRRDFPGKTTVGPGPNGPSETARCFRGTMIRR
jgi:hypothetical protein